MNYNFNIFHRFSIRLSLGDELSCSKTLLFISFHHSLVFSTKCFILILKNPTLGLWRYFSVLQYFAMFHSDYRSIKDICCPHITKRIAKLNAISPYLYHTSSLIHRDRSSVMFLFGLQGWGFGSSNIRHPRPNDPVAMDLTPTPIPAAKLSVHTRQMTSELALSMGIIFNFATANQS